MASFSPTNNSLSRSTSSLLLSSLVSISSFLVPSHINLYDSTFSLSLEIMPLHNLMGPWGGNGGTSWDDGTYNGVREIKLVYDRCIDTIRVVYDKNGKPFTAEKHGGVGGNKTVEIKLQYPDERLVSVSGHHCPVVRGTSSVIRSLAFKSNKRTFGPFGVEDGTPFALSMDGGLIVGFNGRSGWYLDAIGFRLSRAQTPPLFQRVLKALHLLTCTRSSAPKDDEN